MFVGNGLGAIELLGGFIGFIPFPGIIGNNGFGGLILYFSRE